MQRCLNILKSTQSDIHSFAELKTTETKVSVSFPSLINLESDS